MRIEEIEMRRPEEKMLPLPQIHIKSRGGVSKVYVDGTELNGVMSISFLHDRRQDDFPVLRIDLLAEQISVDTAQVFALPEVYHPYYVSADKLVDLGILTYDKLNTLLEKGLL